MNSSPEKPQVSVITVVRNGAQHLEQCLQSVLTQTGVRFEYIVIDGGSTDGSTQIIERHASSLAYTISEPDKGIADAMNKGIRQAHGEWTLFLHADDYLCGSNVLEQALRRINPEAGVAGFSLDRLSDTGVRRRTAPLGFTWRLNFKTTFQHQATLIRRDLFDRLGMYDERYRVEMDYEFFLRLYRAGVQAAIYSDHCLSVMRATGLSSQTDWPSLAHRFREERAIHFLYVPSLVYEFLYRIYWPPYLLYRWFRSVFSRSPGGDRNLPDGARD